MAKPDIKGMSLRQVVQRKVHHGNGFFKNPFNHWVKGDLRDLLKWKFFSKNHFTSYYKDEPVTPNIF
ncbi:MAG: hypothetical protein JRF25_01805 [Deltaproteobacteria bacterium]|nr:hypothetical protein [Deltaproteobacteria bacterium]